MCAGFTIGAGVDFADRQKKKKKKKKNWNIDVIKR